MYDPSQHISRPASSRIGRWLILAALIFAGLAAGAQPVDPAVTLPDRHCAFLTESLEIAIKQSPQMIQKNIELAKADAQRLEGDSIRWPSLFGNGRYLVSMLSATNAKSTTSRGLLYNLEMRQSLFRWGDIKNTLEIDQLTVKLSQKNYAESYRDLVTLLRTQFMQLILQKRYLSIIRINEATTLRLHKENEEKLKSGQISHSEFAGSEITVEEVQIAVQAQEMQYEQLKRSFARLSGRKEVPDDCIPDDLPTPEFSSDQAIRLVQDFDQKDMARSTPTAESKLYVIRQSELKYKLANTRLLPKVDLSAGINQENTTNFANQSVRQNATNQKSVGIVANWSIFDGFYTRGAKRIALEEKREAEQQLALYFKTLDEQRQSQIGSFGLAARSLALAERRLAMSRGGLAYAEEEYKLGRQSDEQLNQIKGNHMLVEYAAMQARVDLYYRWSDLVSLLWLDPALQKLPATYLSHGK
ncbi:MAG: TolC family protein [Opitutaceae bacterium]